MPINLFNTIAKRAARTAFVPVPFVRTLVVLAIPAFLASCAQINSSPDTTTPATAAVILSADSVEYPNACRLDSASLRAALGLTDEQVARIITIQDSLRSAAAAEITAANADRHAIHEILEKYEDLLRTQIEAVLTADQLAKLKSLFAMRGDGSRDRDGGHRGVRDGRFSCGDSIVVDSAMLAQMTADLSLTPTQITQIQTLAAQINADTTVTDIHAAFMTGLQTILTADQLATLNSLIENHEAEERDEHERGEDRGRGRGHGRSHR